MTLDELKNGNYALCANSFDEFSAGMKLLEELGFTWKNGKKFSEEVLHCEEDGWYYNYRNDRGIRRFETRNPSYYIIEDGCKLSKKVWPYVRDNHLTLIYMENLVSVLGLDVDEDGFEKEIS